jgi:hypothetical protein
MSKEKPGVRNYRISTTHGMSGYFAVMLADYEDMGWNTDVVNTGVGGYSCHEDAIREAISWAEEEDIPYVAK